MSLTVAPIALMADATGNMQALRENDLMATLLILVFGMALGVALICLLMVVYCLRTGRLSHRLPQRRTEAIQRPWRSATLMPGAPCRWLAVRTNGVHWVQTGLRLHNPSPCSWEEGLSAAHDHKLFISPPIGGWVLVLGAELPDPADDVDRCFHFLTQLSRKLGQVQFFSYNRVVNHHAWAVLEHGRVQRAYAWAGRTLWNQGRLTRAESDLRLRCYDYTEPCDRMHFAHGSPAATNTERVLLLASRWSIDPSAVSARMLRDQQGITGDLVRFKLH